MRKTLIITAASACLAMAFSAQANLVLDPNFASSGLSDWTVNFGALTSVTTPVYSGSGTAGELGVQSSSLPFADISQTVTLPAGSDEIVSFYVYTGGTQSGILDADLGNVELGGAAGLDIETKGQWTYYSFLLAPTDTGTGAQTLDFDWNSGAGGKGPLYLDDVTVTPTPEASTIFAGAVLLVPLGAGALRSLRKNRMA